MPSYLKNIITPTGRAALVAFVIASLGLARVFGIVLPEVTDDAVSKTIDSLMLFLAVAFGGSYLHKAAPPASAILLCIALPIVGGCASFGHWQDPTLEELTDRFCGRKAQAHEAELKREAQARGIPLAELLAAFQTACLLRMNRTAESAGMDGVRAHIAKHEAPKGDQ